MNPQAAVAPVSVSVPRTESCLTLATLDRPAFLMNLPLSYSTEDANNAWMKDIQPEKRVVNQSKAMKQFFQLYHFMAADAAVYLLPSSADCDLQDLVFTANIGFVPEHLPNKNVVILSNFTSPPRVGETEIGRRFFKNLGYEIHVAPAKFEGEAELKHLHDNVYLGGYGIRSEIETYEWMELCFDMEIVKLKEVDEYLYHLDTTVFPLSPEDTLVCTEMYEREEIKQIAKHTNIIDISGDDSYSGICNSVRLYNTILNASNIHEMKAGTEEYTLERAKNQRLEDIAVNMGFEVNYFNLSEYLKGGALLSCLIMHLNRNSYKFKLL